MNVTIPLYGLRGLINESVLLELGVEQVEPTGTTQNENLAAGVTLRVEASLRKMGLVAHPIPKRGLLALENRQKTESSTHTDKPVAGAVNPRNILREWGYLRYKEETETGTQTEEPVAGDRPCLTDREADLYSEDSGSTRGNTTSRIRGVEGVGGRGVRSLGAPSPAAQSVSFFARGALGLSGRRRIQINTRKCDIVNICSYRVHV